MVEIARALSMNARVLILDEPTSSLTDDEVDSLFGVVRALKDDGVATIFVSHRMSEIFALADNVTVLRDGRTVASGPIGEYDRERLIERMVGREPTTAGRQSARPSARRAPLLRGARPLRAGRVAGSTSRSAAGEIVGLAGLAGSGRSRAARGDLRSAARGRRRDRARRGRRVATAPRGRDRPRRRLRAGRPEESRARARHELTENLMMPATSRAMRLRMPAPARRAGGGSRRRNDSASIAASPDAA